MIETHEPPIEELLTSAHHLAREKRLREAERLYRQVLRSHPDHPEALHRLGEVTLRAGAPSVAQALVTKALSLRPDDPALYQTLGAVLRALRKSSQAERAFRRALELEPTNASVQANLGLALLDQGKLTQALEAITCAIDLAPDNARAHQALGVLSLILGRAAAAVASFRRATELDPASADARSGLLFALHYLPDQTQEALTSESRRWGQQHAEPLRARWRPFLNRPDPARPLRIGYVSADFREHPVGRILQAVLPFHDPAQFEVFCYPNDATVDGVTTRLRDAAHVWRSIVHLSDDEAADLVRADAIDILIDLSGHTGGSRLLLFARKPAPVQATWLGYFNTTGLRANDYLIADNLACPAGSDPFYTERLERLPHSFLCWAPPEPSPAVGSLPALSGEGVTFGCLNNSSKITPEVVALWSQILRAVPSSRLLLKYFTFDDPLPRDSYAQQFLAHGITPDRIIFLGRSTFLDHLETYHRVDIALDPFPYNGGSTTLDALWMGVPVVTLRGDRFVSRMGTSILSTAGLHHLVASSPSEYVQQARALAGDLPRLAHLRSELRPRLQASPLCDGPAFTRGLEATFRGMWMRWCASHTGETA